MENGVHHGHQRVRLTIRCEQTSSAAERSSILLWLKREEKSLTPTMATSDGSLPRECTLIKGSNHSLDRHTYLESMMLVDCYKIVALITDDYSR